MLVALMVASESFECCGSTRVPGVRDRSIQHYCRDGFLKGDMWMPRPWMCLIAPQFEIDQYRVDFCILFQGPNAGECFHIIVECDRHDFHEKTKKQAMRDKKRDRHLQAYGFKVFRFTGSEIWNDPHLCAEEVYEAANKEMYKRVLGPDDYAYAQEVKTGFQEVEEQ
jgi:very-short-patch-repair endonuclease